MRGIACLVSLATMLGIAVAALASGDVVRDDARHFEFELPDVWMPFDDEEVDEIRAVARKAAERLMAQKSESAVIAAFCAPCGEDGSGVLFVTALYQPWAPPPRTYAGIEKRVSREIIVAAQAIAANLDLPIPTTSGYVIDRERRWVTSRGTVTTDEIGTVPRYTVGLPGREGIVWLHAFARPEVAESAWKVADDVALSFRWDEGYEFREEPVAAAIRGPYTWRDEANRWSVTVPEGWTMHPARPGEPDRCIARFGPPGAELGFDPYVMAAWIPAEVHSLSWDEFQSFVTHFDLAGMISGSSFAFGATRSTVECSPFVFDKHRGRLTATYSMEFAGIRWNGVLVNCFGRDGGAVFVFFAMEKDFAAAQPAFDALVESFRLDDGHGWRDAFPFETIDWAAVWWKAALIAGIAALGVAALWAFVRVVRSRASRADVARARERLLRPDSGPASRRS